jgi:hypothetical protein
LVPLPDPDPPPAPMHSMVLTSDQSAGTVKDEPLVMNTVVIF